MNWRVSPLRRAPWGADFQSAAPVAARLSPPLRPMPYPPPTVEVLHQSVVAAVRDQLRITLASALLSVGVIGAGLAVWLPYLVFVSFLNAGFAPSRGDPTPARPGRPGGKTICEVIGRAGEGRCTIVVGVSGQPGRAAKTSEKSKDAGGRPLRLAAQRFDTPLQSSRCRPCSRQMPRYACFTAGLAISSAAGACSTMHPLSST